MRSSAGLRDFPFSETFGRALVPTHPPIRCVQVLLPLDKAAFYIHVLPRWIMTAALILLRHTPILQLLSSSSSSCSWSVRHVSLFLDHQDEVGPSISSSVVLCFFVLLVYTVVLVLVVCLCPSSVHVVATFPGTVLFPLLCSVLQFFA